MRVDINDITQISGQIPPLVQEADSLLDAVFQYLHPADTDRADFTDFRMHAEAASRVGRLLEIFAETYLWGSWAKITQMVIDEKGEAATIGDVNTILSASLARRTAHITAGSQYGAAAALFMGLIAERFATAIITLNRLEVADVTIHALIDRVAPGLGLTPDGCYEALRAGDRDVAQALASAAVEEAETAFAAKGLEIPTGLRGVLDQFAMQQQPDLGTEPLDEHMRNVLGGIGIDTSGLRKVAPGVYEANLMTGMAAGSHVAEENIKVG